VLQRYWCPRLKYYSESSARSRIGLGTQQDKL
jgi:hypothetical protein